MSMARFTFAEHFSAGDVQSGEEGGGAVAYIMMRHPLHIPQSHGQNWLSAIQGLNLALFVDTQDHGIIRGIKKKAHIYPNFFQKKRIGGEGKMLLAMGLEAKSPPHSLDAGLGLLAFLGQGPATPMGGGGGGAFQGPVHG